MRFFFLGVLAVFVPLLPAQQPIGRTSATEVKVSGAVDIAHGEMLLGNGSEITAGDQAVAITLQRGGELRLCATSSVHLSKDISVPDPASSALMMALDHGAIETRYTVSKYSDVLLTPDLRILISGPGEAQLSVRVNPKGDTCV
ncbi:MAG: nuclease, partial [Acidobacteriaceae bacterium]